VQIDGAPLAEPAEPLDRLLRVGLARHPDAVAVESAYRRLSWAELEEEMPLNPTGKVDRVGLKRMAEDHLGLNDPVA
jgi:hypothetical protein